MTHGLTLRPAAGADLAEIWDDTVEAWSEKQAEIYLAGLGHSSIHNHFNQESHLYSRQNFKLNRAAALTEWRQLCSA